MRNRPVDGAATPRPQAAAPRPAAAHPAPQDSFMKRHGGALTGAALGTAAFAADLATGGAIPLGAALGFGIHKAGQYLKDKFTKKTPVAPATPARPKREPLYITDAHKITTLDHLRTYLKTHGGTLGGDPQKLAAFKNIIDQKTFQGINARADANQILHDFSLALSPTAHRVR
ncbi:MAG: hypothetical protein WCK42_02160 [Myxococcaceae bacterium]